MLTILYVKSLNFRTLNVTVVYVEMCDSSSLNLKHSCREGFHWNPPNTCAQPFRRVRHCPLGASPVFSSPAQSLCSFFFECPHMAAPSALGYCNAPDLEAHALAVARWTSCNGRGPELRLASALVAVSISSSSDANRCVVTHRNSQPRAFFFSGLSQWYIGLFELLTSHDVGSFNLFRAHNRPSPKIRFLGLLKETRNLHLVFCCTNRSRTLDCEEGGGVVGRILNSTRTSSRNNNLEHRPVERGVRVSRCHGFFREAFSVALGPSFLLSLSRSVRRSPS